jgi:hypothetical protein
MQQPFTADDFARAIAPLIARAARGKRNGPRGAREPYR